MSETQSGSTNESVVKTEHEVTAGSEESGVKSVPTISELRLFRKRALLARDKSMESQHYHRASAFRDIADACLEAIATVADKD